MMSPILRFLKRLEDDSIQAREVELFLQHMSGKKLEPGDIVPFIRYMHERYPPKEIKLGGGAVNIVGTGGGRPTFNISTTAAFVAAAAGAVVIKSGSSSYGSRCGTLDVQRALGLNVNITFERFERMISEIGLGFVNPLWYAPLLRRLAITVRPHTFKSIGGYINTMGPLLCPVTAGNHLIGVRSHRLIDVMAAAADELKIGRAVICWSDSGIDEFCSLGTNYYREVGTENPGVFKRRWCNGFSDDDLRRLNGGPPGENAEITRAVLSGGVKGVKRDTVLLNSAYILLLAGRVNSVEAGLKRSEEAIDGGGALKKLEDAVAFTNG